MDQLQGAFSSSAFTIFSSLLGIRGPLTILHEQNPVLNMVLIKAALGRCHFHLLA